MPELKRKYPVMEIAVLAKNMPDHISERACIGDIIAVRRPGRAIGKKEKKNFIWLIVEGLEEEDFYKLLDCNYDDRNHEDVAYKESGAKRYEKRRFCIPFKQIKKQFPDFDINRAIDENDTYQPFMILDDDNLSILAFEKPLRIESLIFDKTIGSYL